MKIIFQQNNTIYTCLPLTCMKCIQCKQQNGRNTRAYGYNWKTYIYIQWNKMQLRIMDRCNTRSLILVPVSFSFGGSGSAAVILTRRFT